MFGAGRSPLRPCPCGWCCVLRLWNWDLLRSATKLQGLGQEVDERPPGEQLAAQGLFSR